MATQTQVLIAHTGQRLQVDMSQFSAYGLFVNPLRAMSIRGFDCSY
jgi:hypothetical protein